MKKVLLIAVLAATAHLHAGERVGFAIPFVTGAKWVYTGTVTFAPEGVTSPSPRMQSDRVTITTEVFETVRRSAFQASRVRGLPLDLMNHPEGPSEYLVVQSAAGTVYLLEGTRATEVLRRLRNRRDPLKGLLQEEEILLSGRPGTSCRECWKRISGASASGADIQVEWRGLTGFKRMTIAPGIGITKFEFQHGPSRASGTVELAPKHPNHR